MTSPTYGETTLWTPLPENARKWETTSIINPGVSDSLRNPSRRPDIFDAAALSDDFAEEAAYHTANQVTRRPRSPELRAHHVWGIGDSYGDEPEPQHREKGK